MKQLHWTMTLLLVVSLTTSVYFIHRTHRAERAYHAAVRWGNLRAECRDRTVLDMLDRHSVMGRQNYVYLYTEYHEQVQLCLADSQLSPFTPTLHQPIP
jgi:hypothetical protein